MNDFGQRVQGECPSCGLKTLFLGKGGYVTCGNLSCKNPTAADELLLHARHLYRILNEMRSWLAVAAP